MERTDKVLIYVALTVFVIKTAIITRQMVRPRRLELPRVLPHSDLNAARLPIPPRPHTLFAWHASITTLLQKTQYAITICMKSETCVCKRKGHPATLFSLTALR